MDTGKRIDNQVGTIITTENYDKDPSPNVSMVKDEGRCPCRMIVDKIC